MKRFKRLCGTNNRVFLCCFLFLSFFFSINNVHSAFECRAFSRNSFAKRSVALSSLPDDDRERTTVPQRSRQQRRRPIHRRPDHYWSDLNNLEHEIQQFWCDHGVRPSSNSESPPIIPNEVLLRYYQRHDLRAAIVKYGGREAVSQLLGNCPILPGRWADAIEKSPELRTLIDCDPNLSFQRPPLLTRHPVGNNTAASEQDASLSSSVRWKHHDGRKPKGYWNTQTLLKEIYAYVADYRDQHQRPAVWMPRPSEFAQHGRDDIRQALNRFGGAGRICRLAGMVPFHEWYYMEGQLQLVTELQRFLNRHAAGDYSTFPVVQNVKRHDGDFDSLVSLIHFYGGRNFLAARLGMKHPNTRVDHDSELNFGPFSLDFAVRLLLFVRDRELRKNPPLANPVIVMPSPKQLIMSNDNNEEERLYLHESIMKFGGYENVARRLGLALHS